MSRYAGRVAATVVVTVIVSGIVPPSVQAKSASSSVASVEQGSGVVIPPKIAGLDPALAALARGRAATSDAERLRVRGDRVLVEILHRPGSRADVLPASSAFSGRVGARLTQAWVDVDALAGLGRRPGVTFIRPPLDAAEPVASAAAGSPVERVFGTKGAESVIKSNADDWQTAGWTGSGIKIGIIDGFSGSEWNDAATAGEVPASVAGTFCRRSGLACDIWNGGSPHGVAVAEVVMDQAPGATIYLASARTAADLQAAVDYLSGQGVRIITRSLTAEFDGAGNGTGPIADVIDSAVSDGIAWFNSAGNNAGAQHFGAYYRSTWRDVDGDELMEFGTGDERLGFQCLFLNGLRWSDWSGTSGAIGATDYDVSVFENVNDTVPIDTATAPQGNGEQPLEHFSCSGDDIDFLEVQLYAPGSGTSGDIIEFMTNGGAVEYSQNPYSATGPAADTANAGAMSVGAIDPVDGTTIASYSSRGPTNDNRIKPNLSAGSNMSNETYGSFNGTSAATPVAAGAGALVLQAYPATTPSQLMSFLQTSAVVDRGTAGADNTYGAGELILPAPPTGDQTAPTVTAPKERTRVGAQIGSTVSTTISWTGSDASGIEQYELWVSVDGAAYVQQPLGDPTQTSINVLLTPGTKYRYTVRAQDTVGNWSGYKYGKTFKQAIRDDAHSSIAYSSGWTRYTRSYAYGGKTVFTTTAGATATVTFTGRGVAWVATRANTSGRAEVYIDGVLKATVNLNQATTRGKEVVYSIRFGSSTAHTLVIEGLGTTSTPWVDVDAVVVTT